MKFNAWELVCLEEALRHFIKDDKAHNASVHALINRIAKEKPKPPRKERKPND